MPRVSEEHLERRRQQIIDAARACFIRKGFYETSMQDIFKEADLSAGAVYRYFKSKNELVEAIAQEAAGRLGEVMGQVMHEDPLPGLDDVVVRIVEVLAEEPRESSPIRIAPMAWAMALNDPQVAKAVRQTIGALRGFWVTYAGLMRDAGRLPEDADPEAVGKVLVGILPGFLLQYLIMGDVDTESWRTGLRALFAGSPAVV